MATTTLSTMNDLIVPMDVQPWFISIVKYIVLKSDKDTQIIFLYTYCQYAIPEDLFSATEELYHLNITLVVISLSLILASYLTTGFDKTKCAKLASFLYLWMSKDEQLDRKLRRKVFELARQYTPEGNSLVAKEAKRFRLPTVSGSYQKFVESLSFPPSPREEHESSSARCSITSSTSSSWSSASDSPTSTASYSPSNSPASSPRLMERHSLILSQLREPVKIELLKHSSSVIAKQMTLIDHELVSSLRVCELKSKILSPEDGKWETVADISTRFNMVSFWVATQIVISPSSKLRVDVIEKFISIAAKMLKYKNYLGVFQILSGLHNSNIRRLRNCWQSVSQRSSNTLSVIEQVMSHTGNYSQYRAGIKECQVKGTPAVPLICLLLQDLTFINDGNDDLTPDGKVNIEKWTLFGSCVLSFTKLMDAKYNFRKQATIKKMFTSAHLLVLPETLIMKHSYAIETRRHLPTHHTF